MRTSWSSSLEYDIGGERWIVRTWHVGFCRLVVCIAQDHPRVKIGRGEDPPREADLLEVEVLAERFNSIELRDAADRMRRDPGDNCG